ncbi:MAG TPA: FCD domain-containing protein [Pirellulales bacterium]|nr:FCD domain-containing protein [Pirellulales bacterium]
MVGFPAMPPPDAASVLERMPDLRESVARRNMRYVVADTLAALIATGVLQVGDVLPGERDLATALQVSRETVRGGVQILATHGVIEVIHGVRTRVVSADVGPLGTGLREPKRVNTYDIESVHQARLLVERPVVAAAAERINAATLRRLADSLDVQRAAMNDPVRFLISDREFHFAIYRACGNPALADFVADLYTFMMEHRRRAVSRPGAIRNSYDDHRRIVAALGAHDPEEAVAAVTVHLDRIYTTTRSILESERKSRSPEAA